MCVHEMHGRHVPPERFSSSYNNLMPQTSRQRHACVVYACMYLFCSAACRYLHGGLHGERRPRTQERLVSRDSYISCCALLIARPSTHHQFRRQARARSRVCVGTKSICVLIFNPLTFHALQSQRIGLIDTGLRGELQILYGSSFAACSTSVTKRTTQAIVSGCLTVQLDADKQKIWTCQGSN